MQSGLIKLKLNNWNDDTTKKKVAFQKYQSFSSLIMMMKHSESSSLVKDFKCFIYHQFGHIQAHCPHVNVPNQIQTKYTANCPKKSTSSPDDGKPVDLT